MGLLEQALKTKTASEPRTSWRENFIETPKNCRGHDTPAL
ncbi:hypothetical protein VS84_00760 [Vibrio cholerae]|nr:hypothetical protein VS84_00760 [Vibrio cholerae]KKP21389.1 hypothetical protein VS86_00035 [Vibrio cholerae]